MKDGKFELNDIRIEPLSKLFNIFSFDCGDDDLNDFLKVDSFRYKNQKLAETILVIYGDKVIGFFSLCTDAIKLSECETLDCEGILRLQEFPAVKIVRLAVIKDNHKKGLGSLIIKIVLGLVRDCLSDNIGCKFRHCPKIDMLIY